jgi:hypothetical protein
MLLEDIKGDTISLTFHLGSQHPSLSKVFQPTSQPSHNSSFSLTPSLPINAMPSYLITGASRGLGLGFATELVSLPPATSHFATREPYYLTQKTTAQEPGKHRHCNRQGHSWRPRSAEAQGSRSGRPSRTHRP